VEKSQTFQLKSNVFFGLKRASVSNVSLEIFKRLCVDFSELFRICASEREAHSSKQIACQPLPSCPGFSLLPVKKSKKKAKKKQKKKQIACQPSFCLPVKRKEKKEYLLIGRLCPQATGTIKKCARVWTMWRRIHAHFKSLKSNVFLVSKEKRKMHRCGGGYIQVCMYPPPQV